ncbi:MAG: hypothetical protein P4L46_14630 [Fimbriimonas sp.]|nr:hypothetical protein [Fimbriimonas sp.]
MVIVYKFLAASLIALTHTSGTGDPSKVKPLGMIQGGVSLIGFPLVRMIQNQEQWNELWTLHKGIPGVPSASGGIVNADAQRPPNVDFAKSQVLVVFGGQVANVQAYDYVRTVVRDKDAVIQLAPNPYPNNALRVVATPFIMLVLPTEKVSITVELDTIAQDGSHFWAQLARFSAPR